MRKALTAILLSVVCIVSCKDKPAEVGSIRGNVYWKYNNFVGNKPDAGSRIYLYSVGDSVEKFETTADVRGDYSIDSVPVGGYLMIVKSKNTTFGASECFDELVNNSILIDTTFNTNIKETLGRYDRLISDFTSKASDALIKNTGKQALSLYDKNMDSVKYYSEKALTEVPEKLKTRFLLIGSGSPKLDIKGVFVSKGKVENVVTDFGITYF